MKKIWKKSHLKIFKLLIDRESVCHSFLSIFPVGISRFTVPITENSINSFGYDCLSTVRSFVGKNLLSIWNAFLDHSFNCALLEELKMQINQLKQIEKKRLKIVYIRSFCIRESLKRSNNVSEVDCRVVLVCLGDVSVSGGEGSDLTLWRKKKKIKLKIRFCYRKDICFFIWTKIINLMKKKANFKFVKISLTDLW